MQAAIENKQIWLQAEFRLDNLGFFVYSKPNDIPIFFSWHSAYPKGYPFKKCSFF